MESLRQAFREVEDTLVSAAEESPPQAAWKGIVNVY